jgi:adenine-specific DNA-methyltransferase
LSPIEQRIKAKIQEVGRPLKDWKVNINYGIKTGFNDAFIITGEKRKELLKEDPKSAEILRPILRGRDIKRYSYDYADLWLLYIPWHFPLHNDPTITGASMIAEEAFKDSYPAIYKHLLQYKLQLQNRNKAETGIRYEWYALQRWGSNYRDDFFRPKIIYPNMTKFLPFHLDSEGFMQNDKSFMITGNHLEFLAAFFNSSLFKYCFLNNFPELQGGTRELRKIFLQEIPVIDVDDLSNQIFKFKLGQINARISQGLNISSLIIEIDNMIFDLYNLSKDEREEIGFIEIQ